MSFSVVKFQKVVETPNKLVIKFLPLEPVEQSIGIIDAGKLIKSKDLDMLSKHRFRAFLSLIIYI